MGFYKSVTLGGGVTLAGGWLYFELEYYYLWSDCNGWSVGEKNTLVPEPCIFIGLFLRQKINFIWEGMNHLNDLWVMKFTMNWNITTYEATAMGGHKALTILASWFQTHKAMIKAHNTSINDNWYQWNIKRQL